MPLLPPLAPVLAALAAFAFGAAYYIALSKPWIAALQTNADDLKAAQSGRVSPFLVVFAAELLMAVMLLGVMGHMGPITVRAGLITAALIWLGFVLPTMAGNHAFQGATRALTLIDSGHWLGVLLIEGAVLGLMAAP